jgi:thymidylate synthase ThyX
MMVTHISGANGEKKKRLTRTIFVVPGKGWKDEKTMKVELRRYPKSEELMWMKECTVGTMGKDAKTPPTSEFVRKLLAARHSPIRELVFSYVIRDIPYWVSVHLVRHHVGFQPYVQSQRNDRQSEYDRTKAPQNQPVTMRVTLNAEALMNLANKRLCAKASPETREVVRQMCDLAEIVLPELHGLLVPACEYNGGVCHEIKPCGKAGNQGEHIV